MTPCETIENMGPNGITYCDFYGKGVLGDDVCIQNYWKSTGWF